MGRGAQGLHGAVGTPQPGDQRSAEEGEREGDAEARHGARAALQGQGARAGMRFSQVRALGAAIVFAVSFGASAAARPRFDKLEETLKIRPEQKEQFDAAVASTQRALVSVALIAMQIKQGLGEELQKPRPD